VRAGQIVVDLLETIFVGFISVAVPIIMIGLIVLIIYAVYREIRGNE
jgi:hypothetical protein